MEQFRDTNYFITKNGEVYNNRKNGLRLVKSTLSQDGYYKVGLFNKGVRNYYRKLGYTLKDTYMYKEL